MCSIFVPMPSFNHRMPTDKVLHNTFISTNPPKNRESLDLYTYLYCGNKLWHTQSVLQMLIAHFIQLSWSNVCTSVCDFNKLLSSMSSIEAPLAKSLEFLEKYLGKALGYANVISEAFVHWAIQRCCHCMDFTKKKYAEGNNLKNMLRTTNVHEWKSMMIHFMAIW